MASHKKTNRVGKQQRLIMGGIALALVLVVILTGCLIRQGSRNQAYNRLYDSAQRAYAAQEYDEALDALKQALAIRKLDVDRQTELYLLMADVYVGQEKPDAAIALLEEAYAVLGDERLNERAQVLIASGTESEAETDIAIGTATVAPDAQSAVLASIHLTDRDIEVLSQITTLQTLNLSGNQLCDITPMASLTALDYLSLADNNISDVSALSGLSNLRTLYLDNNPIEDLSPLYGLQNLTLLSIKGIELTREQVQALCENLANCSVYCDTPVVTEITLGGKTVSVDVTELELIECGISDIADLAYCTKLEYLNLQGNNIVDISPLSGLTSLKKLILWDNEISDLRPLQGLTNLTYLDIDANKVQDLTPLQNLKYLTSLWCSGNDPASLEPLLYLTGLNRLGLNNDGLNDGDLEWLKSLTKLTELRLDGNDDLTAQSVDSLQSALPACAISRPAGATASVTLGGTVYYSDATTISCQNAGVSDISGLSSFTRLTSLDLGGNPGITSVSAISGLTNLSYLSLNGCSGVADAAALYGLQSLRTLDVTGTGLSWEQVDMLRACLPACTVYSDAVEPVETAEGDIGAVNGA